MLPLNKSLPTTPPVASTLASIWINRGLFQQLLIREISQKTKSTLLGASWLVIQPIMMLGLYVTVFGVIFRGTLSDNPNESPLDYAIGIYIGLTIVGVINESLNMSPSLIIHNRNLVKKVIFPLELLPISLVAGNTVKLIVNFMLIIALAWWEKTTPSVLWLWIPVLLLPVILFSVGISWLISALGVFIPDIQHLTGFFSQIIFWSSGIFYSSALVEPYPAIWHILQWHPVFIINEQTRGILLWESSPNIGQFAYFSLFACLTLAIGVATFHKLRPNFADQL